MTKQLRAQRVGWPSDCYCHVTEQGAVGVFIFSEKVPGQHDW